MMKKSNLPKLNIPGPPEDLVEILAKENPLAWDRGWHKLIGHADKSKIFQHACRGDLLTLVLLIYNAKLAWKVSYCVKCESFFYIGPC